MTLISLADCCRRLCIDPKTLRRWRENAHISVQPDPLDARLKCVTQEQLKLVAVAHHRALAEATPFSVPQHSSAPATLPNAMCASVLSDFAAQITRLTEQLVSLQAHVTTLQTQLTLLAGQTCLEPSEAASASQMLGQKSQESSQDKSEESSQPKSQESSQDKSEESSQPKSQESSQDKSEESSQPKSQESSQDKSEESSQPKSQESSQEATAVSIDRRKHPRVLPLVEYATQGKYVIISPELGRLECSPDSAEWFTWLSTIPSFRFVGEHGHFTAFRGYQCSESTPWWAHRQIRNHTSVVSARLRR